MCHVRYLLRIPNFSCHSRFRASNFTEPLEWDCSRNYCAWHHQNLNKNLITFLICSILKTEEWFFNTNCCLDEARFLGHAPTFSVINRCPWQRFTISIESKTMQSRIGRLSGFLCMFSTVTALYRRFFESGFLEPWISQRKIQKRNIQISKGLLLNLVLITKNNFHFLVYMKSYYHLAIPLTRTIMKLQNYFN